MDIELDTGVGGNDAGSAGTPVEVHIDEEMVIEVVVAAEGSGHDGME